MPSLVRTPAPSQERAEQLAINLYDLDRLDPTLRAKLFSWSGGKPRLDMGHPLRTTWDRVNGGTEEVALIFACPLLEAALICDAVRMQDRAVGDFPSRLYVKRKTWTRLPSHSVLTVMRDGRAILNPQVFAPGSGDEEPPVEAVARPRSRVEF